MAVLNLASADRGLAGAQRRFFDEGLPPTLSAAAFQAFDRARYEPETIAWALEAWQLRTLDEYRSQVGFTELLMELTELGCAFDTLTAAVRVVRDEARHVELCRRLVVALGGTDEIPGEPKWVRSDSREPPTSYEDCAIESAKLLGNWLSLVTMVPSARMDSHEATSVAQMPSLPAVATNLPSDLRCHLVPATCTLFCSDVVSTTRVGVMPL